jgi:hypothetical protein
MSDHDEEIREALLDALNGGRAGSDANKRMLSIIARAQAEGRTWPEEYIEQAIWNETQRRCKQLDKDQHRVWVDYHGNKHHKAAVVGRRSKPGEDGTYQQALITSLTWEQLADWGRTRKTQAVAELVNVRMWQRLEQLRTKHPQTSIVQEALDLEGVTLEAYLAGNDD